MKKFVNKTPHVIRMNDGREFPPVPPAARVSSTHSVPDEDGIMSGAFGEVENLPEPEQDTIYIVSAIVAARAAATGRNDVVSPATGHRETVRKDGQPWSVPGFVRP